MLSKIVFVSLVFLLLAGMAQGRDTADPYRVPFSVIYQEECGGQFESALRIANDFRLYRKGKEFYEGYEDFFEGLGRKLFGNDEECEEGKENISKKEVSGPSIKDNLSIVVDDYLPKFSWRSKDKSLLIMLGYDFEGEFFFLRYSF